MRRAQPSYIENPPTMSHPEKVHPPSPHRGAQTFRWRIFYAETMHTRGGGVWRATPRGKNWRGEPPTHYELRAMMPDAVETIVGMEQILSYFKSDSSHEHLACARAKDDVLQKFRNKMLNFDQLTHDQRQRLVRNMIHHWRERAATYFEQYRREARIDASFEPFAPRARNYADFSRRIVKGTKKMFDASTPQFVHADLFARIGGCLCWGTWASVIDPRHYAGFSKFIFPFLRLFGAQVKVSMFLVQVASSIFRVPVKLNIDEIRRIFPVERYVHWGALENAEASSSRRFTIFIMEPIVFKGLDIRGLVWRNPSSCSRELDMSRHRLENAPARLLRSLSEIPTKIRKTLEQSGCTVQMRQILRLCGESAVIEHLRRQCREANRRDVFDALFPTRDDGGKIVDAVDGLIVFNPSGREELMGHWGVAVRDPRDPDGPPLIISTNMHFTISPEFQLLEDDLDSIGNNQTQTSKVLTAYLRRTNANVHGRENVFLGSKWSNAERRTHLPRLATNGVAAARHLGQCLLPSSESSPALPLDQVEALRERQPQAIEARIARVVEKMESDAELWSPRDLTLQGTLQRMWDNDQRNVAHNERYRNGATAELRLNPGCYLIFCNGDIFGFSLGNIPERAAIAAVEAHVDVNERDDFDVHDDEFSDEYVSDSEEDEFSDEYVSESDESEGY